MGKILDRTMYYLYPQAYKHACVYTNAKQTETLICQLHIILATLILTTKIISNAAINKFMDKIYFYAHTITKQF